MTLFFIRFERRKSLALEVSKDFFTDFVGIFSSLLILRAHILFESRFCKFIKFQFVRLIMKTYRKESFVLTASLVSLKATSPKEDLYFIESI